MSFKKNAAVPYFKFGLIDASSGAAVTSGTVSGYVTIDDAAQAELADSVAANITHMGNGTWKVDIAQAEMNGDCIELVFVHTSAIPVHFTIWTDTKRVSDLNDTALTTAAIAAAILATPAQLLVTDANGYVTMENTADITTTMALEASITAAKAVIDTIYVDTQRVDGLLEDSSGDRYTTKALEQAPAGSGNSIFNATDRANIEAVKALTDLLSETSGDLHVTLDGETVAITGGNPPDEATVAAEVDTVLTAAHGTGSWISGTGVGSGSVQRSTPAITVGGLPVGQAEVHITLDSQGNTPYVGPLFTDDDGTVEVWIDLGVTYYIWATKHGAMNPIEAWVWVQET